MNSKVMKIMTVNEYRETFTSKFDALKLDHQDKMKIAIRLNISLSTVIRYTSGDAGELRKFEVAESILSAAKEVLREKKPIAKAV